MIEPLYVPIYKCSVVFLIESTEQEWQQFYEANIDIADEEDNVNVLKQLKDANALGWCIQSGDDCFCYIKDKSQVGVIVHEIFHATNFILLTKGCAIDIDAEPWAYLLEYLINEFYKILDRIAIEEE